MLIHSYSILHTWSRDEERSTDNSSVVTMETVMNSKRVSWTWIPREFRGQSIRRRSLPLQESSSNLFDHFLDHSLHEQWELMLYEGGNVSNVPVYMWYYVNQCTNFTCRNSLPHGENPNCLHTTPASFRPHESSHTVPHWPLLHNSILPS